MRIYLIAANFWALLALMFYVGKTAMRSSPDRYAMFGVGRWFGPSEYAMLLILVILLSSAHFAAFTLSRLRDREKNSQRTT
jgi:predicted MFS family arabinose efflux permease